MYYEYMKSEQQQLEREILELSEKLKQFPEGKLICKRNGTRYKWYQCNGSKKIYISKKDRAFAEKLAEKTYLISKLNDLKQKQDAVNHFLSAYPKTSEAESLLDNEPEFQNLLLPHLSPLSKELDNWEYAPYEKNQKYPEQLLHKTCDNQFVRSKSEAMIAMALRFHKIPFRYECLLEIGNYRIYPDFTLRHPTTGKIYYWEHFGMMDDPVYIQKTCLKLRDYILNGLIPSINLITTYETREEPLSTKIIENLIQYHDAGVKSSKIEP